MTMAIVAAGWVTDRGYGSCGSGKEHCLAADETIYTVSRTGIFPRPVRNFGRLDKLARITLVTVALALQDAGIDSSPENKQAIGIIGTNNTGSLETDTAYFQDYLDNGRKLARANLFIYTLPSSPLGEAAIHFGLTGPLLYAATADKPLITVLRAATEMVSGSEAAMMLVGMTSNDQGIYLLLKKSDEQYICPLDELLACIDTDSEVVNIVDKIRQLMKRG